MAFPHPRALLAPALAILGLTSFAFAQPALDIFGDNAEFFVAHGTTAAQTLVFALVVYFVPALVLIAVVGILGLWKRSVGRAALAVVGGVLTATAVLQLLPSSLRDLVPVYVAVFIGAAGAAGWAFLRTRFMVRFWRVMGVISPVVLISFLFFSPAGDIVFADDVDVVGVGASTGDDVVFVILDELSLAAVVDSDGAIDEAKVPNLARLARQGTFYADTTTVSSETVRSVPGILSGRIAEDGQLPLASQFPQNLFTLLAPSHELVVDEIVTQLCPEGLCDQAGPDRSARQLYDDARIVYLHTLLPSRWARAWLPDITTQWAGFGDEVGLPAPVDEPSYIALREEVSDDQAARAEAFIERLGEPREGPRLDYVHLAVPHMPYVYLPDGRRYNGGRRPDGLTDRTWSDDPTESDLADFRYQLQVAYVDGLVGSMIDALEASGRFDQSMVVVVSDHGVAHRPGLPRRVPTQDTLGDVAWVPLVIKYPDQQQGRRVDDRAQTIDIMPTIAEALGVVLEDPVDGRSLLGSEPPPTRRLLRYSEWDLDVDGDLEAAVARIHRTVPAGVHPASSFGLDALRGRTGTPVAELVVSDEPVEGRIVPDRLDLLLSVDPTGDFVPAFFPAGVEGLQADDHIAIFLDGVLAGSGRVGAGGDRLLVMLDPSAMTDGRNSVSAYLVGDDLVLRPVLVEGAVLELDLDGSRIVAVEGEQTRWDTEVVHPGFIDVRPGDRPDDPTLLVGWAARCGTDEPAAQELALVVEGAVVPTTFDRVVRGDVPCLDGRAEVGFSLQVAPDLAEAGSEVRIVALFDDGTFTVLE